MHIIPYRTLSYRNKRNLDITQYVTAICSLHVVFASQSSQKTRQTPHTTCTCTPTNTLKHTQPISASLSSPEQSRSRWPSSRRITSCRVQAVYSTSWKKKSFFEGDRTKRNLFVCTLYMLLQCTHVDNAHLLAHMYECAWREQGATTVSSTIRIIFCIFPVVKKHTYLNLVD
jgi:hypothetical protein